MNNIEFKKGDEVFTLVVEKFEVKNIVEKEGEKRIFCCNENDEETLRVFQSENLYPCFETAIKNIGVLNTLNRYSDFTNTVEPMLSTDYKERFRAEYHQLRIRLNKLNEMLDKLKKNQLDFTPKCPNGLLSLQVRHMESYLYLLEERAVIEGIEL